MNFDGDVKLRTTEDGGAITFSSGQPEMECGLSTAIYISLATRLGWWGNSVSTVAERIGCECEELEDRALNNKVRLDMEEAARQALKWMVDEGIAASVTVEVSILSPIVLGMEITIAEPSGDPTTLRYKINWQGQRAALEEA